MLRFDPFRFDPLRLMFSLLILLFCDSIVSSADSFKKAANSNAAARSMVSTMGDLACNLGDKVEGEFDLDRREIFGEDDEFLMNPIPEVDGIGEVGMERLIDIGEEDGEGPVLRMNSARSKIDSVSYSCSALDWRRPRGEGDRSVAHPLDSFDSVIEEVFDLRLSLSASAASTMSS